MARRSGYLAIAVPVFEAVQAGVALAKVMAVEGFPEAMVVGAEPESGGDYPSWKARVLLHGHGGVTDVLLTYSPYTGTFSYGFDDGYGED